MGHELVYRDELDSTSIADFEQAVAEMVSFIGDGRLLRGSNVLLERYSLEEVALIKNEALRRSQLAKSGFSVLKHSRHSPQQRSVRGFKCVTDVISDRILSDVSVLFKGNYTVGVREACSDESLYDKYHARYIEERSIEWYSVDDLNQTFGNLQYSFDIGIQATVADQDGKPMPVLGLNSEKVYLLVDSRRSWPVGREVRLSFVPDVSDLCEQQAGVYKVFEHVKAGAGKRGFVVMLKCFYESSTVWCRSLQNYLSEGFFKLPAVAWEEERRTYHNLKRDYSTVHSPWLPILCDGEDGEGGTVSALISKANSVTFNNFIGNGSLGINARLWSELVENSGDGRDAYLLVSNSEIAGENRVFGATLEQLLDHGTLGSFLRRNGLGGLKVFKFCVRKVSPQSLQDADFDGYSQGKLTLLGNVKVVVFVLDVSEQLIGNVGLNGKAKNLSARYIIDGQNVNVNQVRVGSMERRRVPRYRAGVEAHVGLRWLNIFRLSAEVIDIGMGGIKLRFIDNVNIEVGRKIWVTIPRFGKRQLVFRILDWDVKSRILRARIETSGAIRMRGALDRIFRDKPEIRDRNEINRLDLERGNAAIRLVGHMLPGSYVFFSKYGKTLKRRLVDGLTDLPSQQDKNSIVYGGRITLRRLFEVDSDDYRKCSSLSRLLLGSECAHLVSSRVSLDNGNEILVSPLNDKPSEMADILLSRHINRIKELVSSQLHMSPISSVGEQFWLGRTQLLRRYDSTFLNRVKTHFSQNSHVLMVDDVSAFYRECIDYLVNHRASR